MNHCGTTVAARLYRKAAPVPTAMSVSMLAVRCKKPFQADT